METSSGESGGEGGGRRRKIEVRLLLDESARCYSIEQEDPIDFSRVESNRGTERERESNRCSPSSHFHSLS